MPIKLSNISPRATESINIIKTKQKRYISNDLFCEPVHSSQSSSPSRQLQYDAATWRMYYRIIEARMKRQNQLRASSNITDSIRTVSTSWSNTSNLIQEQQTRPSLDFPSSVLNSRNRARIDSIASEASEVQFQLEF